MTTPFRVDVGAQAQALRDLDQAPVSLGLYPLVSGDHDRIIFTGKGASHFAALPSWRRMMSRGIASWWIDTADLLKEPGLVTTNTLLIATSRSGMCNEMIELVRKFDQTSWPATFVAITENLASPLAEAADCEILLRSRSSGSPTGFLNALAAHDYIASMILREDNDDVATTARVVAATTCPNDLQRVASTIASNPQSRLAFIGFDEQGATALYAALLTNEMTPLVAEGHIGGQVGGGLPRSADPNLTVMVFGRQNGADDTALRDFAADLLAAGSTVIIVGGAPITGSVHIGSPPDHVSAQVAHGAVVAEHFVSSLATAAERVASP
jgi:fructoselysine-6-P-deglycase FrlB-like protein